jgi:flagellar hook protein FlgE
MSLFSSALSGIQAAAIRHNVTANNIANMTTTDFKKSRVILESAPYENGVAVQSIQQVDTPGTPEMSNVDLAEETVNDITTQTLFRANIASIRAGDEMLGTLLDIIA